MKATDQVSKTAKDLSQAAKAKVARKTKPASRKLAASAKRASRTATKRLSKGQSTFAGYSDSAARLIARGKAAFGDAYAWAGEAGSALPKATRDHLPDQKSLKTMIDERPLIIGAVGLGIGVGVGVLFAPRTGDNTRQYIKSKADEGKDYLKRQAEEVRDAASTVVERAKERATQQKESVVSAVKAGKEAYQEAVTGSAEKTPAPHDV